MSAPTSRLAKCMRGRLGASQWSDFVRHANENYKSGFVRAFEQPTLRCVGTLDGAPCQHGAMVDLRAGGAWGGEGDTHAAVGEALERLHLDVFDPRPTCGAATYSGP